MRIIFIFSIFLLFVSCKRDSDEYAFDKDTYILQNKELEEQIIEYKKYVYSSDSLMIANGDSVTIHVFYKVLNDSLDRFVIVSITDPEIVKEYCPYQCVIKVDGTDIFFHFAYWENHRTSKTKYVGMFDKAYEAFVKRFYPKTLEPVFINGKQVEVITIYDQILYFLTFKNGSLIDVAKERGLPDDRVSVNIDGKIVRL